MAETAATVPLDRLAQVGEAGALPLDPVDLEVLVVELVVEVTAAQMGRLLAAEAVVLVAAQLGQAWLVLTGEAGLVATSGQVGEAVG
jgi:hypothetical protein